MAKGLFCVALLFLTFSLFHCNPYKTDTFRQEMISSRFSSGNSETPHPKDFLKAASQITMKPIHSGDLKVRLSKTINLKHPACSGMIDKELTVPIFAYLIHHEIYGYYLIDSGCDSSYAGNPYGPMKGLLLPKVMSETILDPKDAIERQLAEIRHELKGVFFTHLHFDHTSGLPALPKNLLYVAGKGEESLSVKWLLEPGHFKKNDIVYLMDFDLKASHSLPLGNAIDIFGDQSLWAISTPGHSKGHVSYLVNTQDSSILITGDACIINQSLETGAGPGTTSWNMKLAQETFDRIYAFAKNNPHVKVWAGHDFPR